MFILHQLQPCDASYGGVGKSAFSTSYGEFVVAKVEANPSPGFKYPVCPVSSMKIDPSCADLYDDWWHDEPGEDATDDASWSDSAESTADTGLDDWGLSCQLCSEVEEGTGCENMARTKSPSCVRFHKVAEIIDIDIGMDIDHEQASISRIPLHFDDDAGLSLFDEESELDEETLSLWTDQHNAWREAEKGRGWAQSQTRWKRERMPREEVTRRERRCAESRFTYMKLSHRAVGWDDKLARDATMRQEREKRERLTPFRLRHAELRKAKHETETKKREEEEEVARLQRAAQLKAAREEARASGKSVSWWLRRKVQIDPENDWESDSAVEGS